MSGVKREAPDEAPLTSSQPTARMRREGEPANADNAYPDNGQLAAIVQRLEQLEAETKNIKVEKDNLEAEVKRLEACIPTKLVEFRFASLETRELEANEWKGVLHVPMIQDPVSGVYSVPNGITKVQGQYLWTKYDYDQRENVTTKEPFVGELERKPGQPIRRFCLGINLEFTVDESVFSKVKPSIKSCEKEHDPMFCPNNPEKRSENPYSTTNVQQFKTEDRDMLKQWEKNTGGVLSFYAPASFGFDPECFEEGTGECASEVVHDTKYKLKLYTVLSAYKPHQTTIPRPKEETKPDWDWLAVVMKSRYPEREYGDIKRGIKQYILFLELKQVHNDYKSEMFSPSTAIDEIWHAHLSFLDRYQKDVQAMTKPNEILEHNPVVGSEAMERYRAARQAHVARMEGLGKPVDSQFWPETPPVRNTYFEENHDGDSTDGLYMPQAAQCGCNI